MLLSVGLWVAHGLVGPIPDVWGMNGARRVPMYLALVAVLLVAAFAGGRVTHSSKHCYGIVHYKTAEEVDRLLTELEAL